MISSNLATLLDERNLSISRVSRETGISRTTLTHLVYNYFEGIQMDTLNSLCFFLDVTPNDIIAFWPCNITFENVQVYDLDKAEADALKMYTCEITAIVKTPEKDFSLKLEGGIFRKVIEFMPADFKTVFAECRLTCNHRLKNYKAFINVFKSLPPLIKTEFITQIQNELIGSFVLDIWSPSKDKNNHPYVESVTFRELEELANAERSENKETP